jgi:hypothetical protein
MRKYSLALLVAIVGVLVFSCGGNQGIDTRDIPDWYLDPPIAEDAVFGVGDAQLSSLSMSRQTAQARARTDIAFQVETTVKAALTDYAQEAGEGDNTQAIEFIESISRQIADITLEGAKTVETYLAKDGRVFALVEYPLSSLLEAAEAEFKRNEAAAFAEFKADQALQQLNFELEDNPPQAGQSE